MVKGNIMKKIILVLLAVFLIGCESEIQFNTITNYLDLEVAFSVSGRTHNVTETTPMELNYPILTYDGVDYNLKTDSGPYTVDTNSNYITYNFFIDLDSYSSFYFMNNNMLNIEGIDPNFMTIEEFNQMLTFLYDPYVEPPPYSVTMYRLYGLEREVTDSILVHADQIIINDVPYSDSSFESVYFNDTRTVQVDIEYDYWDMFLFISGVMYDNFGIDMNSMTRDELVITADILKRFPEEEIVGLLRDYPK